MHFFNACSNQKATTNSYFASQKVGFQTFRFDHSLYTQQSYHHIIDVRRINIGPWIVVRVQGCNFLILNLHITFQIAFCIYNPKKCKFAPKKLHEPGIYIYSSHINDVMIRCDEFCIYSLFYSYLRDHVQQSHMIITFDKISHNLLI